jgi:hypothetical protein
VLCNLTSIFFFFPSFFSFFSFLLVLPEGDVLGITISIYLSIYLKIERDGRTAERQRVCECCVHVCMAMGRWFVRFWRVWLSKGRGNCDGPGEVFLVAGLIDRFDRLVN